MPTNNYQVTVTQPAEGTVSVEPKNLGVQAQNVGDNVVVTFVPGEQTQITGIAGFPSGVTVSGPNALGQWTASYNASSISSIWSYFVNAIHLVTMFKSHWHDPEIDNTPPG